MIKKIYSISIDPERMEKVKAAGLINLSAVVESFLRDYANGIRKRYKCFNCNTAWFSVIEPNHCIVCNTSDQIKEVDIKTDKPLNTP